MGNLSRQVKKCFLQKCDSDDGGNWRRDILACFKLSSASIFNFSRKFQSDASPWKDLFTFILTFCYINNDFLFIFRKPHNKYKLPLDLSGEHDAQQRRK